MPLQSKQLPSKVVRKKIRISNSNVLGDRLPQVMLHRMLLSLVLGERLSNVVVWVMELLAWIVRVA
jgi:hypothetical protein